MSLIGKILHFLENNKVVDFSKRFKLKSLNGLSLYEFIAINVVGFSKGIFSLRVAAVSWSFFMSLFPFIIFLFGILPLAPNYAELESLILTKFIPELLPDKISGDVVSYIQTMPGKNKPQSNFSWIFVLLTIYLSSNGVYAMMTGFRNSYQKSYKSPSFVRQKVLAIVMTLIFTGLIIVQLFIVYYTSIVLRFFKNPFNSEGLEHLIPTINLVSIFIFYFISVVLFYYLGSDRKIKIINSMPGALLSALLFFTTLFGFQIYIKYFNRYDVLYGSVGLILILMLFIYINVMIILIGHELNSAISLIKNKPKDETIDIELRSLD